MQIDSATLLALVFPLAALQLGLAIFCIVKIVGEGTANLGKPAWILIVLLVNLLGPAAFLLFGRRRDL